MTSRFHIRPATPDDTAALAALYSAAGRGGLPAGRPVDPAALETLMQTGSAFVVAEAAAGDVAGAVRFHDDDGIAWFDLLVALVAGAGKALVRSVETGAQDRGVRLVRIDLPDGRLPAYFERRGYRTVSRAPGEGGGMQLVLEKRLPLLTVREQRRADAEAIGQLTGEDPWVYEQGARPGVFVAADGDRVVGVVSSRDGGGGLAQVTEPALLDAYLGRGLEAWMVERASTYAETNGYHTAELPITPRTDAVRKALEDRLWYRDSDRYIRRYRDLDPAPDDD